MYGVLKATCSVRIARNLSVRSLSFLRISRISRYLSAYAYHIAKFLYSRFLVQ